MKVSFEKPGVATPVEGPTIDVVATPAASDAVPMDAPATSIPTSAANPHAVALRAPREDSHAVFDDNDIRFEDIRMSRLNLVQRVGDMSEIFTPGELVLDTANVLYTPELKKGSAAAVPATPPLILTVIGFKKTVFVEKIEGGAMGALYRTEEDVEKNGGTLDYKEWKQSVAEAAVTGRKPLRRFDRMATMLALVEKPAQVPDPNQTLFPFEIEGRFCKLVFWSLKASLYNNGAKFIFTDRKFGPLKDVKDASGKVIDGGYTLRRYHVTTELMPFKGVSGSASWIPKFELGEKNSPEFRKSIRELLGVE